MNFKQRDGVLVARTDISVYLTVEQTGVLQAVSGGQNYHRVLEQVIYDFISASTPKPEPVVEVQAPKAPKGKRATK